MGDLKKIAGIRAAEYAENGMTIGLGSGSTVYFALQRLGEMVRAGLDIRGIPTSTRTEALAREFGIPLTDFSETTTLDLTIDGADEIDSSLNLIKGGGGALLREKLVAAASKKLIIVADDSKLVNTLGKFPLPLEIVRFGWETTVERIEETGVKGALRNRDGEAFVSDNGNYIFDCHYGSIADPAALHTGMKAMTGVVETGLFIAMADLAVIAGKNGVEILERAARS